MELKHIVSFTKKNLLLIVLLIGFFLTLSCTNKATVNNGQATAPPDCCPKEEVVETSVKPVEEQKENKDNLVFKGCSIIRRAFMSEAGKAYEAYTGMKVIIMGGGATLGIRSTAAGDADIGGSCRPPLPELFNSEKGVIAHHVAWDALVFITHKNNPVKSITLQQAKDIILGKITNWKELGGPDKKIVVIFRSQVPSHGGKVSGVGYMARLLLFNDPTKDFTNDAIFYRHSSEVEEAIESIDQSFGITGLSSAQKRKVKILDINGYAPTKENIIAEKYPLFRPLYIITLENPAKEVNKFIEWLVSNDGQKVISEQRTINLDEGKSLNEKFKKWNVKHVKSYYK